MPYLLNVVYLLLLLLFSPLLAYRAMQKGKYRAGWAAKFLGRVPLRQGDTPCIWLHAVSVGEVKQLAPLLERLARRFEDWDIVISTTTSTGYELARAAYPEHAVFYCPLDFSWAVRTALARVRPDLLVLVELELWPNLIRLARRSGAAVAIVNGRLSAGSARGYARIGPVVRSVLQRVNLVAVQNDQYAERFRRLGATADAVHVTGSIKFDGAVTNRANPRTEGFKRLANIQDSDIVFLAGSTQHPEEQLALQAYRDLAGEFPHLRLLIAPRHPERFDEVAELLKRSGLSCVRRTSIADPSSTNARILLIDTVGELAWWWGLSHIAFVGGSMGKRGGQNMIEPAAYGAAVSFGPNTSNFRDIAAALLDARAAVRVADGGELTAFVRRCLQERSSMQALGESARGFVASQLGAADRTVDLLALLAPRRRSPAQSDGRRRFDQPHVDASADSTGSHRSGEPESQRRPF